LCTLCPCTPCALQVIRKLVEDATIALGHSRDEAAKEAEAQAAAAAQWEARQLELKAAKGGWHGVA